MGTPQPPPAAPAPGGPAASPATPPTPEPPKVRADGLPAWLPDKFKTLESLNDSYAELERKQFQRRSELRAEVKAEWEKETFGEVPASPADYVLEPFKTKDHNGRDLEAKLDPEDPLTKWFQNVAHEMKLGKDKFAAIARSFIETDLKRGPSWAKESAALEGGQAELRLDRINGWAKGHLPQDLYNVFASVPATAGMIRLFEHVMTLSGEPRFMPADNLAGFQQTLSKADVEKMMADPRYWRDRDPQHIATVRAAMRKLSAN